jgi:putative membrane protein
MKRILIVMLAIAIGLFVGCSKQRGNESAANNGTTASDSANTNADANANTNANAKANLSDADKDFMNKAAQGGRAEVVFGEMAAKYGTSDEVKSFGERMVNDHKAAGDKLKQLADQKGVTLNDGLPKDVEKDQISLGKKKGKDFDKAYMSMMVKDHEADVKDFQKEADNGQDPDVKAFASSTLPTLQDHLNLAKGKKNDVKKEPKNKTYTQPQ